MRDEYGWDHTIMGERSLDTVEGVSVDRWQRTKLS